MKTMKNSTRDALLFSFISMATTSVFRPGGFSNFFSTENFMLGIVVFAGVKIILDCFDVKEENEDSKNDFNCFIY